MQTNKPLISILMAVYEPRLDWLKEQLDSLNAQTYPNLRLYIRDDCSTAVPIKDIEACVRACITRFPYIIARNEQNFGSNRTFECLTQEAKGEYFAYCDQDDIWLPVKLSVLQTALEESGALLACSDMYIINEKGKQVSDSITKVRRRHRFQSGKGLAKEMLIHNFVSGCTMLVRSNTAKAAIPFCPYMVHDHYLALWCAERGELRSIRSPLICYRIHGGNQTGVLSGVSNRETYGRVRIAAMLTRLQWLQQAFPCGLELQEDIRKAVIWAEARQQNWMHRGGKQLLWKYRKFSLLPSIFELFAAEMPEPIFHLGLKCGKYGALRGFVKWLCQHW